MMFGSPPYPALALHLAQHFARSESFSLHSRSALRCRTLSQSGPPLAGLVPLMGKASVSNITVSLALVVVPKALAMAPLYVLASPFTILPPSLSQLCPLAQYYYFPLPGWHPTAHPWLTPYCPSLAAIPSARWLRSPLYPPRSSHSSSVTASRGIVLLCYGVANTVGFQAN